MNTAQDAKTIADRIIGLLADEMHESFVATWNLRAFLLRVSIGLDALSRDDHDSDAEYDAELAAARLGLDPVHEPWTLTPLGREVAELLRPRRWSTEPDGLNSTRLIDPANRWVATFHHRDSDAELPWRIAAGMATDDMRRATTYRTEAVS